MKDIAMIIQNTPLMNQAALPAARAHSVAPTESKVVADTQANNVPRQPSAAELKTAVETLNKAMQQSNQNLEFSVDTDTKKVVVKMVDTSTGQLIRQFPSEETLAISRGIEQFQQGLLLKQKA
ncbi:MAG: flagellar protein FlaG [Pseudomonadota bacterium]